MDTLFLVPDTWDLAVDAAGNIAVATLPYSAAQDVASACRLWLGEALYDTTKGIPYKAGILGKMPPPSLLTDWYQEQCLTVPDIAEAVPVLQYENRNLTGQLLLTLNDGTVINVNVN